MGKVEEKIFSGVSRITMKTYWKATIKVVL